MKYRSIEQIEAVAAIHPTDGRKLLSRCERLERWADALERCGGTVRSLHGTEFTSVHYRGKMREDGSALTVALEDPVLRGQGLADDTYGAALEFFELSHADMHRILCYCHAGHTISAQRVAERVRSVAEAGPAVRRCLIQMAVISGAMMAATALAALM